MATPLKIIDSHTGGEPTRVIVDGLPDLGDGSMAERRKRLASEHDWIRRSTVLEPRGFEAMVGAVLQESSLNECIAGVIFYNNTGYLNMCGHGTIGLAATLQYMGRLGPGSYNIETPVGVVRVHLDANNAVSVENVPSYCLESGVCIEVPGYGEIVGDIAWGGNWFFLLEEQGPAVDFSNIEELITFTRRVRAALKAAGYTGDRGQEIDHIELFGPSSSPQADSRNFVLCPGNEYDRSSCGTGLSARLACLAASDTLAEGQIYRQAGILNTIMEGHFRYDAKGRILPTITASAWINGETTLIINPQDPFRHGIDLRAVDPS